MREDAFDVVGGERLAHLDHAVMHVELRARDGQLAVQFGHVVTLEEYRLVRKDVCRRTVEVVELEQVGVEEARGAGGRHDDVGADRLRVADGALHLVLTFGCTEAGFVLGGELVHDGPPHGTGVLEEVNVDRALGDDVLGMVRPAVVLVEHATGGIADQNGRIADRPV